MKAFLTSNLSWILPLVFVLVFLLILVRTLRKARKIDREGIITDAVVSRVWEDSDAESAGTSYVTCVTYRDEEGKERESFLARTMRPEYVVGQELQIRYIPGEHKIVRPVKDL